MAILAVVDSFLYYTVLATIYLHQSAPIILLYQLPHSILSSFYTAAQVTKLQPLFYLFLVHLQQFSYISPPLAHIYSLSLSYNAGSITNYDFWKETSFRVVDQLPSVIRPPSTGRQLVNISSTSGIVWEWEMKCETRNDRK